MAPRWPQDGARWPKDGPKMVQDGPKMAQDTRRWPKMAQDGPKMAPRCPKMAPRWPKIAQDSPKMAQDGPKMAPRWLKMVPRRPQDGTRWPQEGPKMAQDSPNMVQWGGLPLRYPPPLPVASDERVKYPSEFVSPLGKRSIPQTPPPAPRHGPALLWTCVLRHFFASVFENVHHSRAVCPLWPFLSSTDWEMRGSKLIKKQAFYRSSSSNKYLEFKTKNNKMKLSLESGDDFMKTMLS